MLQWAGMEYPQRSAVRPHHWRNHRRQEWLMIYLPLLIGLMALIGLGILLGRAQVAPAGTWADAGLALLLLAALAPGLVLLALVMAVVVGVWYAVRWLPLPMERGRAWLDQAARAVGGGADLAARPVIAPSAFWAALTALWRSMVSIFRPAGDGER
jgi:hypothetical protein